MYLPVPYDIYEKIGSFADIDTRRFMNLLPRKISKERIFNLESLMAKKLANQYHSIKNKFISTLFVLSNNHVLWLKYDYRRDTTTIIDMNNYKRFTLNEDENCFHCITRDIIGNQYKIFKWFDKRPKMIAGSRFLARATECCFPAHIIKYAGMRPP